MRGKCISSCKLEREKKIFLSREHFEYVLHINIHGAVQMRATRRILQLRVMIFGTVQRLRQSYIGILSSFGMQRLAFQFTG